MNLLDYLEKQAKFSGSPCVSYDELTEWPAEQIEEAKQQGCLVQTDDAEGIICRQCPKRCWKDVEIRQKDGQSVGVYFCEDEDCAGLIKIKTERLQQWQINKKRLSRLGYGTKAKELAGRKQSREKKKQNEMLILQVALLEHHKFGTNTLNYEPITQKQLGQKLKLSQSKVSRLMTELFGNNPMDKYKQYCRTEIIAGFLRKLDNGAFEVDGITKPVEESE